MQSRERHTKLTMVIIGDAESSVTDETSR